MTKHWAMNQAFALTVGTASAQGLMTVCSVPCDTAENIRKS